MRIVGIVAYLSFSIMSLSWSCEGTNLTHGPLPGEYYFPAFREHAMQRELQQNLRHRRNHMYKHGFRSMKRHHVAGDVRQINGDVHHGNGDVRQLNGYALEGPHSQHLEESKPDTVTVSSQLTHQIWENKSLSKPHRGGDSVQGSYEEMAGKTNKSPYVNRSCVGGEGRTNCRNTLEPLSLLGSPKTIEEDAHRKVQERETDVDAVDEKFVEIENADVSLVSDGLTEISDKDKKRYASSERLCRSVETFLPPDLYVLDTCALCYWYIHNRDLFVQKWERIPRQYNNYTISVLFDPSNHSSVVVATMDSQALMDSFSGEEGRQKWHSCCKAARECCQKDMRQAPWPPGYCPPTWDGWQCWPSTPPNTEAKRACPSYSYHGKAASCSKMATKQCEVDGRWFRLSRAGKEREWSNYSSCSVAENVIRRLYVHIAADILSTATLLPALFIFFSYKQLRVHRITLHKHLFISLLLEATGNICFRLIQLHRDELIQQNPTWCITLNLFTKYASLTNYMWYLCEGYYLHKLLASAFAEQNSLFVFYFIGWVFPLVPLGIYTALRAVRNDSARCWLVPIDYDWIMYLPPLLALLINIIFLVNIIRILVSKVRATNSNEPSQYRKAVRATMMVVPLFGLQYIVTIYRPQGLGCYWHDFYQIFNNVIDGSTGAVVAIIFCYTNGEVKGLIRRSYERYRERRAPQGSYMGSQAAHSRSFSTVQTTLVDPSPARRTSSVVSVCINSQVLRRSASGLRFSKANSLTSSDADGNSQALLSPRKSSKNFLSNPLSKSPQLLEELEDSTSSHDEKNNGLHLLNDDGVNPNAVSKNDESSIPLVTFSAKLPEPVVNINTDGTYAQLEMHD